MAQAIRPEPRLVSTIIRPHLLLIVITAATKSCKTCLTNHMVHTVWHKILTVENIDKLGLGKFFTSKKLTNVNVFIISLS